MATLDELARAMRIAHDKGDKESAKKLAMAYMEQRAQQQADEPEPIEAEPAPEPEQPSFARNLINSGANYIKNTAQGAAQLLTHPVDTARSLVDLAGAGAQQLAPDVAKDSPMSLRDLSDKETVERRKNIGDVAGPALKARYGGWEQIKNTAYTDPVGMVGDISSVLTLGGGVAPKLGKLGQAIEPINVAINAGSKLIPKIGRATAALAGSNMGTSTGSTPIIEATKAALAGGADKLAFTDNLRGKAHYQDVLDDALANVGQMRANASNHYREQIAPITNDRTTLNFNKVDAALEGAFDKIMDRGVPRNDAAHDVLTDMKNEIVAMKRRGQETHDVQGFDTLKQRLYGIIEKIPHENRRAKMAAQEVYAGVKDSIVEQAPDYAKVMKDYETAQETVSDIQRAMSLKDTSSADTALKKLQSVMRNNAHTNYGGRLEHMATLENEGGRKLMPALAGQALSAAMPRSLGGLIAGGTGIAGLYSGSPAVIPIMAMQSPRVVGEVANMVGTSARYAGKARKALSPNLINLLQQTGRLNANQDENQ